MRETSISIYGRSVHKDSGFGKYVEKKFTPPRLNLDRLDEMIHLIEIAAIQIMPIISSGKSWFRPSGKSWFRQKPHCANISAGLPVKGE